MSGFGRSASSSQANSSSSTTTSSVNNNIQPTGGGVAFGQLSAKGPVDINVSTSDLGAISGALGLGESALQSNSDLAKHTVDAATTLNQNSFDLVKSISSGVLDFSSATNKDVIDAASANENTALNFGSNAFSLVDKALQNVASSNANALSVAAASTSSTYASTEIVKYVLYGLGAIAVAVAVIYASK